MSRILWSATALGALLALLGLFVTLTTSNGAPQEAAGAAISLGFAIIPYVLARAWDEATRPATSSAASRSRSARTEPATQPVAQAAAD